MDNISERDEGALKHLVDIRLSYFEKPGFRLDFEFSPNEHFTNTILTKSYYYQDEPGYGTGGVKNPKKQRHKGTNKIRVVKKVVPTESFFGFFTPPVPPKEDDEENEEEFDEIDEKLELDYNLGEELKDNIIPHAVDWFTGKALQLKGGDDQYEDEFMYDDDEEEEEKEEEEDEDEDDDELPAKDEKAPECKQQ
ncbi:Nucleosome assembly protein 1-like 1 [Modicella reniformis]|uniref:Nucleosome assembly protein 1-like 1 n=1 Tax=Modicella reniformis TaxID=1440133 RepID=A0A9P6ILF9_9FUNG|nr:Nucleosome assembly protein 1-like 1 [Modicella reniformis]